MPRRTRYVNPPPLLPTPNLARHLFSLPPEIRGFIYSLTAKQSGPIRPNTAKIFERVENDERGTKCLPAAETVLALARTCKQARDEFLPVYFGENCFEFQGTSSLYVFLYMIGQQRRQLVRDVEVWWHGVCQEEAFALLGECIGLKRLSLNVSKLTTSGTRKPQTDLWRARGIKQLQGIRDLKGLHLQVREFVPPPVWGELWHQKILPRTTNSGGHQAMIFQEQHVVDFESSLGEEMRRDKVEGDDDIVFKDEIQREEEKRQAQGQRVAKCNERMRQKEKKQREEARRKRNGRKRK